MLSAAKQLSEKATLLLLLDGDPYCVRQLDKLLAQNEQHSIITSNLAAACAHPPGPADADIVLLALTDAYQETSDRIQQARQAFPDRPLVIVAPEISIDRGHTLVAEGADDFVSLAAASHESLLRTFRYTLESRHHNAQIDALRHQDSLTDLANRPRFYREALSSLAQVDAGNAQVALLTIDLDGFRKVNTLYGHTAGDQIVIQLAGRLELACRGKSLLARLGGDEFALLLEVSVDDNLDRSLRQCIESIVTEVRAPYLLHDRSALLPCSIGVATTREGHPDLDELLRRASLARLQAKQHNHCSYHIYSPALDEQQQIENALEPELAGALRGDQFELFFQPQVDLKTGRIAGAETLVRWIHPTRGLVMPGSFIAMCERNGMIIPIGYWAIHRAGLRLKELHQAGYDHLRVGVNLSFRQFQDSHLAHTIQRIIQQNQINSAFLEFELTESALISDEKHVSHCLKEMANLSIDFALDDFGTGYSSFALLQKLPISTLKIDRSFIRNVTSNPNDAEIVRAIINLAHNLDKKVVAEGVEQQDQFDFLMKHGCDFAQGYLISPPVPFEDFRQMLEQETAPCGN